MKSETKYKHYLKYLKTLQINKAEEYLNNVLKMKILTKREYNQLLKQLTMNITQEAKELVTPFPEVQEKELKEFNLLYRNYKEDSNSSLTKEETEIWKNKYGVTDSAYGAFKSIVFNPDIK